METDILGQVLVEVTIENLQDVWDLERGMISEDRVRRATIKDALVDADTLILSLPTRYIDRLGIFRSAINPHARSMGNGGLNRCDPVRLTIQDRLCTIEVLEVPDNFLPRIGRIALQLLDFVLDPRGQRLIGNPAHGGEQMFEMY
jgi:hypothetical protein